MSTQVEKKLEKANKEFKKIPPNYKKLANEHYGTTSSNFNLMLKGRAKTVKTIDRLIASCKWAQSEAKVRFNNHYK